MAYREGDRVSVNLSGLHPLAGIGCRAAGTIRSVRPFGHYTVRVDVPLADDAEFEITDERLTPLDAGSTPERN